MSASLVGSEMCIRDRESLSCGPLAHVQLTSALGNGRKERGVVEDGEDGWASVGEELPRPGFCR
eukprot:10124947-Alexandrium_andersonii.AAC.1